MRWLADEDVGGDRTVSVGLGLLVGRGRSRRRGVRVHGRDHGGRGGDLVRGHGDHVVGLVVGDRDVGQVRGRLRGLEALLGLGDLGLGIAELADDLLRLGAQGRDALGLGHLRGGFRFELAGTQRHAVDLLVFAGAEAGGEDHEQETVDGNSGQHDWRAPLLVVAVSCGQRGVQPGRA